MHLYWTGVAADLCARWATTRWTGCCDEAARRRGLRRRPRRVAATTSPFFLSTAAGGARRRWLPLHRPQDLRQPHAGVDAARAPRHGHLRSGDPKIVHAFMPRDTPGYTIKETWDTLGMRATRSDDTILDGAFVPDRYIARVVPAGAAPTSSCSASSRWAEPTFASIYLGRRPSVRSTSPSEGGAEAHLAGARRARWPTTRRSSTRSRRWRWSSKAIGAPRAHRGRLVQRRGPRRALADEARVARSTTPSKAPSESSTWR